MLEKHAVFSITRALSNGPMRYQSSTPPGEKCGLAAETHGTRRILRVCALDLRVQGCVVRAEINGRIVLVSRINALLPDHQVFLHSRQ